MGFGMWVFIGLVGVTFIFATIIMSYSKISNRIIGVLIIWRLYYA